MHAVHAVPDGTAGTVAANRPASLPLGEQQTARVVDLVVERLNAAARTIREVHDEVDGEDPSTADLLHMILLDLEKYAWMLAAENRSA